MIRFYAAAPIHDADGTRIGTQRIWDRAAQHFDEIDMPLMQDLALSAEGQLLNQPTARSPRLGKYRRLTSRTYRVHPTGRPRACFLRSPERLLRTP